MKKLVLGLGLSLCSLTVFAAAKPCDELKSEIEAKIQANGATQYTLEIVDKGSESDSEMKVVGSCDGGAREIVYKRG